MRSRGRHGLIIAAALAALWLLALACPAALAGPHDPPQGQALQKLLADLEAYAEVNRQAFGIPGLAMAVVAGDKVVYSKGLGTTALGGGRPVDENTVFQIGSTSKSFTAALLAVMADQGRLQWQDRVIDHLPSFRVKDPWVTREFLIADLLAQHSGLSPHAGDLQAILGFGPEHMIDSLRHMEPVASFRSTYAYQNIPHLVAAKIVSRYTGKDFDASLQELVFDPLGMRASSVPASGLAAGDNVTRLHQRQKGQTVLLPQDWPLQDWIYAFAPAGGINSSLKDMAQWLRLNINRGEVDGKRLVSAKGMDYLHAPTTAILSDLAKGQVVQYCQGWVYTRYQAPYTMIWHNGDTSANHAMIAFMPEHRAGIVLLSNLSGVDMLDELAHYFCDLYAGLTPGDYCAKALEKAQAADKAAALPPRPQDALAPRPLAAYAGVYVSPVYGKAAVAIKGQGLVLTLGPRKVDLLLKPWNGDLFTVMNIMDPDSPASLLGFEVDLEGRVSQFTVDMLRQEAGGLFTRVKE